MTLPVSGRSPLSETERVMRRVALASFIGALLEWFDFYAFATAAALVFDRLFFPMHDPALSIMASFGALASGFLARPLGGVIFGHIGDRVGRKASLVATLLIIGIGTFGIGLLPSYARIGATAPVLLVVLRVLQGIGLGGEYGGAALMTIEHAPQHSRGFWGSLPQAASPGGLLLATALFGLLSRLPHEQFMAWGWRVPFLLSLLMLFVGLFIRLRVEETHDFSTSRKPDGEKSPMRELMSGHKRSTALAVGARLAETVSGNMVKSFGLAYVAKTLLLPSSVALHAMSATAVVGLFATPFYGWLSDRWGRRTLYLAGCASAALLAFPFFAVLSLRTSAAVWVAFVVAYNLGPTLMLSVQPTFFTELFRVRVRYTALSLAYQMSAIIGGFTPLIAVELLRIYDGRPWGVAGFLMANAVLSFTCTLFAHRLTPDELDM